MSFHTGNTQQKGLHWMCAGDTPDGLSDRWHGWSKLPIHIEADISLKHQKLLDPFNLSTWKRYCYYHCVNTTLRPFTSDICTFF